MDEENGSFAPGVEAWLQGIGSVRNLVRQSMVSRQLNEHLPADCGPLEVLDAGCGQGTQAIQLARLGHRVTGLDISDELLSAAARSRRAEPEHVRQRLAFEYGDVMDLSHARPGPYDLVCCHGVAMYLSSLEELVHELLSAARGGGLISLLTRNQAGIAMRAGMAGEWEVAMGAFDAPRYTNRLGISGARADEPAKVRAAFSSEGARILDWYGVRLFSDHLDHEAHVSDLDALVALEEEAGRRDPYRGLAALTHTVAVAAAGGG